jgi:hypothetical protein
MFDFATVSEKTRDHNLPTMPHNKKRRFQPSDVKEIDFEWSGRRDSNPRPSAPKE